MKKTQILCLGVVLFLAVPLLAHAEDRKQYQRALKAARGGNKEFAFMHYRRILTSHPESRYLEQSLFAKAEYYVLIPDLRTARQDFSLFLDKYPESEARLFALAHLLQIARRLKNEDEARKIEKTIIDFQQTGFIFRDHKEVTFLSPLNRRYIARFFIDKIEFYADDELFAEMFY